MIDVAGAKTVWINELSRCRESVRVEVSDRRFSASRVCVGSVSNLGVTHWGDWTWLATLVLLVLASSLQHTDYHPVNNQHISSVHLQTAGSRELQTSRQDVDWRDAGGVSWICPEWSLWRRLAPCQSDCRAGRLPGAWLGPACLLQVQ